MAGASSGSRAGPAGRAGLSLLLGFGIVTAGWDLASHLRHSSVEALVFGSGSGSDHPASESEWTAVLLFTPMECPGLMSVVDQLNELADRHLTVRGLLLVDQRRFPRWQDLVSANRIGFPVWRVDPAVGDRALAALGDLQTPVVALFDRAHRIRLISDLADQPALISLIRGTVELDTRQRSGR